MDQGGLQGGMEPVLGGQPPRPLHQMHQQQPGHFEVAGKFALMCRHVIAGRRGGISSDVFVPQHHSYIGHFKFLCSCALLLDMATCFYRQPHGSRSCQVSLRVVRLHASPGFCVDSLHRSMETSARYENLSAVRFSLYPTVLSARFQPLQPPAAFLDHSTDSTLHAGVQELLLAVAAVSNPPRKDRHRVP